MVEPAHQPNSVFLLKDDYWNKNKEELNKNN